MCRHEIAATSYLPEICAACQSRLLLPANRMCRRCGRQFASPSELGSQIDPCQHCESESYHFSQIVALGVYRGPLQAAIVKMKHAGQQSLTTAIGRLLGIRLRETHFGQLPEAIFSVPMHWRRRLIRGEGTSAVLAESVGREAAIPVIHRILRCARSTQKQSTLRPHERKRNVRGAFQATSGARIQDRHVALVDDTVTTGATANEAAATLLAAGAARVTLVAIARAE